MRKHILLILFLLLYLIPVSGCGGDDSGTISPATIPQETQGYGSIYVKVLWPERETAGKCIISAGKDGEENTLTASMPQCTDRVEIKVYKGSIDPNNIVGQVSLKAYATAEHTFDSIPIGTVIVTAESWSDVSGGILLSRDSKELKVELDDTNYLNMDLGAYFLELTASSNTIAPGQTITITAKTTFKSYGTTSTVENQDIYFEVNTINDVATFSSGTTTDHQLTDVNGECQVTLKLDNTRPIAEDDLNINVYWPVSSTVPDPFDLNYSLAYNFLIIPISSYSLELTPDKPIIPVGSSSVITVTAKKLDPNTGIYEPLEGIQVYMGIDASSTGEVALIPDYFVIGAATATSSEEVLTASSMIPLLSPTMDDGTTCGTIFGKKPGTIKVLAEFQDPDDPNTIISGSCNVEVTSGNITYLLKLETPDDMTIPPDFRSEFVSPDNESFIQATLFVYDEDWNEIPIPDEEIKFSVDEGSGEFEGGLTTTKITTYEEGCHAILTTDPGIPGPREIKVKVEYVPDPNETWVTSPLPATWTVQVSDGLVYNVDFNKYSVGTSLFAVADAEGMGYRPGHANHWDTEDTVAKQIIVNGDYGNCAQLYTGTYGGSYGGSETEIGDCVLTGGYKFTSLNYQELRFYVKVGNEQLNKFKDCSIGGKWYRGICGLGNSDYDLLFRTGPSPSNPDIYDGTKLDCSQELEIGNFVNNWVEVRIQYLPQLYGPQLGKICYWYGGIYREYDISGPFGSNPGFYISSGGGSVWYDEIKQYELRNFKKK